jgi:hypothetical protein
MRVPSRAFPCRRGLAAAVGLLVLASAVPAAADTLPPAPENVAFTPAGFTEASTATATWTVPAGTPAGTTARWSVCRSVLDISYPCEEGVSDTPGTAQIPTEEEGHYRLRLRLVSADGEGPEVEVHGPVVDRTAPSAPQAVQLVGDRLTWWAGGEDVARIARAHWRLCRGYASGAVARSCVTGVTDVASVRDPRDKNSIPFSESAAALAPSPVYCDGVSTEVSLWLEDAAGHVDERNAGRYLTIASPSCPPPPQNRPPVPPAVEAGPAATRLTVSGRVRSIAGRPGRRRVTVTAALAPREAAGRVVLRVTRRGGGTSFVRTRSVPVRGGKAVATFTLPRGVRRAALRATYAATPTHRAASATRTLRVAR